MPEDYVAKFHFDFAALKLRAYDSKTFAEEFERKWKETNGGDFGICLEPIKLPLPRPNPDAHLGAEEKA